MEGKKISFGFMKTKKVDRLVPVQEKKDFIECVEEKSIKVIGGEEVKEIPPLIIPMKPNTLITSDRLKEIAEKVESALIDPEIVESAPKPQEIVPENETLEQMAVRELLEDSKKAVKVDTPQLTLTLPAKSLTSGEKESTLDDYESVPVQDFGMAMLRGMGWTKSNEKSTFKAPQLRPKGLGLGADKVVKDKQKVTKNSKDEELTIVKNAFVKITTGKYSGYYGKVLSLDEDNGRVMVDITVKKETVSLSEFMMYPVTKAEFDKESKVINANSFEQYKKNEGQKSTKHSDKESRSTERYHDEHKHEKGSASKENNNYKRSNDEKKDRRERSRDRSNRDRYRDSSQENYDKSKSKRSSSPEYSSDSDNKKHNKKKAMKQYSSMESLDSDTDKKSSRREIDYDSESKSEKRNKRREKERKRYDSDSDTQSRHKDRKRQDSVQRKKDKYKKHSSDSESDRKGKKYESKRYSSDSDSDHRRRKRSNTPEGKRDIDKKRKGKKKKRDRDRSPNYRKHRK